MHITATAAHGATISVAAAEVIRWCQDARDRKPIAIVVPIGFASIRIEKAPPWIVLATLWYEGVDLDITPESTVEQIEDQWRLRLKDRER